MIQVKAIEKRFGDQLVLDQISFEVTRGGMLAVVGPSGTGKSVLIKIITGLMMPDAGDVFVDGCSMITSSGKTRKELCSKMGILFQAAALFDSISLLDNVAYPLRYRERMHQVKARKKALEFLEQVGLAEYAKDFPNEVSMAMKKRIGIARALVSEPEVIFFDEPNTGLDPETGQEIYDLIRLTHQRFKFTGIVISHEIPEVFQVCDKVAMLYQGKVQALDEVDRFVQTENAVVRQFLRGDTEGPIQMASV